MKQKLKFQDILLEEKKRHYADLVQSCARRSRQFNLEDFVLGYTENCRQYIEAENLLNMSYVNGSGSLEIETKRKIDIRYHSCLLNKAFLALKKYPSHKFKSTLYPFYRKRLLKSCFRKLKLYKEIQHKKQQLLIKQKQYQKWRALCKCFDHWREALHFVRERAELLVVLLTKWEEKHLTSTFTRLSKLQNEPLRLSPQKYHQLKSLESWGSSIYDSRMGDHKFSIISTQVSTIAQTPRIETVASSLELPNQLSSIMLIDQDVSTPQLKPQKQRTFTFSEPHQSHQFTIHNPLDYDQNCLMNSLQSEAKTAFLPEAYLSRTDDCESASFQEICSPCQEPEIHNISSLNSGQGIFSPDISSSIPSIINIGLGGSGVFNKSKISKKEERSLRYQGREVNKRGRVTKEMVELLRRVEGSLHVSLKQEEEARVRLRQERLKALE